MDFLQSSLYNKFLRKMFREEQNMKFNVVRNDITNMRVDAVVNTANPNPVIGCIEFGDAAITPAFGLDGEYIIHLESLIDFYLIGKVI